MKRIRRHDAQGERGATAVEYALVIGLVSLLIVAGTASLGDGFAGYVGTLVTTIGNLLPG